MPVVRYASSIPYPAYAFVPGRNPHPVSDPAGHSYGKSHVIPEPLDSNDPGRSLAYREALDLFNAGYFWEAHEVWEGLWIAAGRAGVVADFLKGLIKCAAAGVKSCEGRTVGVTRHARRAAELFESVRDAQSPPAKEFCGLVLDELIRAARLLAEHPEVDLIPPGDDGIASAFQLTPSGIRNNSLV